MTGSRKRGRRASGTTPQHQPIPDLVNERFTLVRIDAPPHVEIRDGIFVTVQGRVSGLKQAAQQLANPRPRPHSLPDIVFLPNTTSILALDDVVAAKPHVIVRTEDLERAREVQLNGNVAAVNLHGGVVSERVGTSNRLSSSFTPAVPAAGNVGTVGTAGTIGALGVGTVGVLTPPPQSKKSQGGNAGINTELLDAADVMSQENERERRKLSHRSLTFAEDGEDGEERGGEADGAVKREEEGGKEEEKEKEKEATAE